MSLELPGAKLLPSATYSGNGEYQSPSANLYYPSSGDVVISPDLEVTGNELVGGNKTIQGNLGVVGQAFLQTSAFGTGTSVPVAFPAGMVGGTNTPDARDILPLPLGLRLSNGSADQSSVTAGTSGGFGTAIFSDGIQVNRGAKLALSGGSVSIGSPTAQGGLNINSGPGQGTIVAPVAVAGPFTPPTGGNIQTYTLAGNRGWFLIPPATATAQTILVVKPPGPNYIGRILPYMDPPLGTAGLSLTLGGGYGGPGDFVFINSKYTGTGPTTWLVGVEFI